MNTLHLAGCVILDTQGRILLLHRKHRGLEHWELPGGKVEQGEGSTTTALREMKEEVGVDVEITRTLGSATFQFEDTLCSFEWFLGTIVAGEARVGEPDKFDELRYVSLEEMKGLKLSANMKNLYEKLQTKALKL